MTDVKISPNAASIHVEGDIGGGGGDEIVCGFTRARDDGGFYTGEFERTTDEDPSALLDAIRAGKIVKGVIHSGAPNMLEGDILYSTAVALSRSGSMGGFGGIEFTFVGIPRDGGDAVLIKLKINTNGSLTAMQKKITAEAIS
jgi:hypothetical protein